ncbi:hypothetical protein [Serratia bockelmannii]|uniref:hypothetical protein n=1 Tax=Serratia bockelmannii TaxID=2703793 RepID=UPI0023610129|nr:hypothetical protein [Serratia bockelmannii]
MKNNLENQDIKTDKPLPMSYEALKADRDALADRVNALAVENAAMKDVFGPGEAVVNFLSIALRHTKYDCIDLPDVALAFKMSLPETPATDAALAAIRNEATARALKHLCDCQLISATVAELKTDELREAK